MNKYKTIERILNELMNKYKNFERILNELMNKYNIITLAGKETSLTSSNEYNPVQK